MKIKQLYDDFNIPYAEEGHRNVGGGWIGIDCPFCEGTPDMHLGYNLDTNHYSCWRCGSHSVKKTLKKILGINGETADKFIKKYRGGVRKINKPVKENDDTRRFALPSGCGPLGNNHQQYLLDRRFDPDRLEREWGLLGTGPMSSLDGSDYKHRIIAPITWDGNIVSFQGRDITDRQSAKYKACSKEREAIHHKKILYGRQDLWQDSGIVVEGITDVWRLGFKAAATFGIKFTPAQVRAIAKAFPGRVFIIFDPEPQAQLQARKLQRELKAYYRNPTVVLYNILDIDPGAMSQEDADYLTKQLIP